METRFKGEKNNENTGNNTKYRSNSRIKDH